MLAQKEIFKIGICILSIVLIITYLFLCRQHTNDFDIEEISWILKERTRSNDTLYRISNNAGNSIFVTAENELDFAQTKIPNSYTIEKINSDSFWNPRTCVKMPVAIASSTRLYFRDFIVNEDLSKTDVIYMYDLIENTLKYIRPQFNILGNIYNTGDNVYFFSIRDGSIFVSKILENTLLRKKLSLPGNIEQPENFIIFHARNNDLYFKYKDNADTYQYLHYNEDEQTLSKVPEVQPLDNTKVEDMYRNIYEPTHDLVFKYGLANAYDVQIEDGAHTPIFINTQDFLKYIIGAI